MTFVGGMKIAVAEACKCVDHILIYETIPVERLQYNIAPINGSELFPLTMLLPKMSTLSPIFYT